MTSGAAGGATSGWSGHSRRGGANGAHVPPGRASRSATAYRAVTGRAAQAWITRRCDGRHPSPRRACGACAAVAYGLGVPPGNEPDYRFTLANERTFLAWLRTALALLAAGVAVQQLGGSLRPVWARTGLSLLCVVLSALASAGGVLRWRAVEQAVRRGEPLPAVRLPWVLTAGLVVLALVAALLVLEGPASS